MAERLRVGVVFGGRSGEHEVSLASAYSVMTALDPARFDVVPIGIDKQGQWLLGGEAWPQLRAQARLALGPGEEEGRVPRGPLATGEATHDVVRHDSGRPVMQPMAPLRQLDVVLPILHGPYGEDGTIQGLLELADIPYVGAGVAASGVCMDKILCKQVLLGAGIPQVPFVATTRAEWEGSPAEVQRRADRLLYPLFVKPANLGSSVGISKVHEPGELAAAMAEAARYDRRIVIEQGLPEAREIEVSVLGNEQPVASVPGEIVPCNEFYDYEAKYVAGESELIIPADLPPDVTAEIQRLAVAAFRALDIAGMARIDFLVQRGTNAVYLNEPNTIPGFTPISMYPKLWAASGLPYPELLAKLIELALERHAERRRNATSI